MYNILMDLRPITADQKDDYNRLATHIVQSWQWGEFREKMGIPVLRYGIYQNAKLVKVFQLTLHKIPFTQQFVGYLPKGPLPDKDLADALDIIGKEQSCAFIKVEPNILASTKPYTVYPRFLPSPKPLFTKHNFLIDLTKSESDLLKNMHPKTRYNIRLAEKKGVKIEVGTSDKIFQDFLDLYFETTKRQGYFGHNRTYHQTAWDTLKASDMARIAIGYYQKQPLSAWMLVNFKDTLYYPYGGSTLRHKEVMANNLVAWEAIKLGQKLHLKTFDLWGALGPTPNPKDHWIGFHTFKERYGGTHVEYIGTFDLIFNETVYFLFNSIDKFTSLKVLLLKILGK